MSIKYYVIEGLYTDPNDYTTLIKGTEKKHVPFSSKIKAEALQKELAIKNIDDYQHRVRIVIKEEYLIK